MSWFIEGGAMMYVVLLAGMTAFAMAVVHAAQPKSWSLAIAGAFIALTLLAGAGGTLLGRKATNDAIAAVDPTMAEQIREQGYAEAGHAIVFAAILAGLCAVPFAAGEIKRRK